MVAASLTKSDLVRAVIGITGWQDETGQEDDLQYNKITDNLKKLIGAIDENPGAYIVIAIIHPKELENVS